MVYKDIHGLDIAIALITILKKYTKTNHWIYYISIIGNKWVHAYIVYRLQYD